jgi:hypothetical protein
MRIVIDFVRLLIIRYRVSRLVTRHARSHRGRERACSCTESGSAPIAGAPRCRGQPRANVASWAPRWPPKNHWLVHLLRGRRSPAPRAHAGLALSRTSERASAAHLVVANVVNGEDRSLTSTLSWLRLVLDLASRERRLSHRRLIDCLATRTKRQASGDIV